MVLSSFKFNFAKVVSLIGNLKANVACSYVTVVNSFKVCTCLVVKGPILTEGGFNNCHYFGKKSF